MKKKISLTLDDEFIRYCELNKIVDIDSLAKKTFQRGFTILKFGETPAVSKGKETIIEKEVIIEVEKIIEVIKEVPVDKIIINDVENDALKKEIEKLKNELNNITESLEKMNKAKYLKGSDLNNLYDE